MLKYFLDAIRTVKLDTRYEARTITQQRMRYVQFSTAVLDVAAGAAFARTTRAAVSAAHAVSRMKVAEPASTMY